jgi:uncharacterized protein
MTRPIALVTGASSGIGRQFAIALAAAGHDLVVVARDGERLKQLADQVGPQAGTEILVADLTDAGDLAQVEARLADDASPVDVLVNNAGFGTTGKLVDLPVDGEEREIRLNVVALARLTRAALPGMIARGRGGVVQVASVAAFQPAAGNATYAGTKAFVVNFGLSVHEELRGTGVKHTVLCPGFTRTEFQDRAGYDAGHLPSMVWMDADAVVAQALKALDANRALCIPGAPNKAAYTMGKVLPGSMVRAVTRLVSRQV